MVWVWVHKEEFPYLKKVVTLVGLTTDALHHACTVFTRTLNHGLATYFRSIFFLFVVYAENLFTAQQQSINQIKKSKNIQYLWLLQAYDKPIISFGPII